jgi:hypothetical protein
MPEPPCIQIFTSSIFIKMMEKLRGYVRSQPIFMPHAEMKSPCQSMIDHEESLQQKTRAKTNRYSDFSPAPHASQLTVMDRLCLLTQRNERAHLSIIREPTARNQRQNHHVFRLPEFHIQHNEEAFRELGQSV